MRHKSVMVKTFCTGGEGVAVGHIGRTVAKTVRVTSRSPHVERLGDGYSDFVVRYGTMEEQQSAAAEKEQENVYIH